VISDYAHHPTAIRANLRAARARFPGARVWAIWQPHTYSRLRVLRAEFATAFADADLALITDVYAAREQPAPGDADSATLAAEIAAAGGPRAQASGDLAATAAWLVESLRAGDVVLLFSAGDGPLIGRRVLEALRERTAHGR
jgi:UDP-N-acetylmuramate--alanine ligase